MLPDHDITRLGLSTMGLTMAQEARTFRERIARVEGWDEKFRGCLAG